VEGLQDKLVPAEGLAIIWLLSSPRWVHDFPASTDLYMPLPTARSGRMMPAPVPT
jgi:hypothetical protein